METTVSNDLSYSFVADKSPQEVFDAINNVRGWWSDDIAGNTDKLNESFKISFGTTWKIFQVTELAPGKKVVWLVTDCHLPWNSDKTEWTGTRVIFDIGTKNGKTQVRFTHEGLAPSCACYGACSGAWGEYITGSLHDLVATGEGQPNLTQKKTK